MTPEQRASEAIDMAHELQLLGSDPTNRPRWHALIANAVAAAMIEARDRCTLIADRIAIGWLIVGEPPNPIAALPLEARGATIPCVICHGMESEGCPGCNGAGIHSVSGELPEGAEGYLAIRPCGCGADWFGSSIAPENLAARKAIWDSLGYRVVAMPWSQELAAKLTEWAGCQHGATLLVDRTEVVS
jgi:hypothetical protein